MNQEHAPVVTIIMPAYNAEKQIRKSVSSVLSQTVRNLELIVVDDGSRDDTLSILQELQEQDLRLRVISVKNGGPANARNIGLNAVRRETEFIMFADADDELLPDAAEKAISAADGADLVLFGFTIVNADGTRNDYYEPHGVYFGNTLGQELANLYKANMLNQVWAKLFRAEMLLENNIRFPDYRWGEDRLFIFQCLEKQRKLVVLPDCLYLYEMHEGESLITGFYDKKPDVCVQIDEEMLKLCQRFGVEKDGFFRYMFVKSIFSCLTNLYSPSCRLTKEEKANYTQAILQNPYIREHCRGVAGGLPAKTVSAVLCSGNVPLNLAAARAAVALGKAAPKLFQKIKHRK